MLTHKPCQTGQCTLAALLCVILSQQCILHGTMSHMTHYRNWLQSEQFFGVIAEYPALGGRIGTVTANPVRKFFRITPEVVRSKHNPVCRPFRHYTLRLRIVVAYADHGGVDVASGKFKKLIRRMRRISAATAKMPGNEHKSRNGTHERGNLRRTARHR